MPHFQIGLDRLNVGRPVGELERGHVLRRVLGDGRHEERLRVIGLEQSERLAPGHVVEVGPRPVGAVLEHRAALLDEGAHVEALPLDELAAVVGAGAGEEPLGQLAELVLQHKVGGLVEQ